ncbi:hypothetical protein FOA43_002706 [Brettanomyces nanus]|uniref:Uncharacterized protein n=1 Tax=Eeniella nana TaxID=13502 RepID=A0A875S372_EENNA|nr:uncharacterized protein FOA43_002706 [Brettanomyces nanus]QPG75353.1 hypothetical protein FOA43_002706 [Brettanomyces nanus]
MSSQPPFDPLLPADPKDRTAKNPRSISQPASQLAISSQPAPSTAAPTALSSYGSSQLPVPQLHHQNSQNSQLHPPRLQKSSRSIRSTPLPPNHILVKQHSTHPPSYHRQFVLLRDRDKSANSHSPLLGCTSPNVSASGGTATPGASTAASLGPAMDSSMGHGTFISTGSLPSSPLLNATVKTNKSKHPKRESSRFIFSVDDNEDEIEEDLSRDYIEGYGEALRQRRRPQRTLSAQQPGDILPHSSIADLKARPKEVTATAPGSTTTGGDDNLTVLNNSDDTTLRKMPSRYSVYDQSSEIDRPSEQADDFLTPAGRVSTVPLDMELEDEDYLDNESISSNESFTLRERQDAINETHPFGIRIWKPAVYKKHRSVEEAAEHDIHSTPKTAGTVGKSVKLFNFLWTITFGLLLFLICIVLSSIIAICSTFTSHSTDESFEYAKLYFRLGLYFFYPFGKIVFLNSEKNYLEEDAHIGTSLAEFRRWRAQNEGRLFFSAPNAMMGHASESTPLSTTSSNSYFLNDGNENPNHNDDDDDDDDTTFKKRLFGRGQWNIGRVVFFILFYLVIIPVTSFIAIIQWLGVFTIPMAKVLIILGNHIRRHPLALSFEPEKEYYEKRLNANPKNESILICTYRSFGLHYYKYTVDGTNIFFINMNFLVAFTILDFYFVKKSLGISTWITDPSLIFVLCLTSIIPLAYFIGQAVASISAQTSMGVGAVINAFFSTIVEVFLYGVALDQSKGKLVEGSIIGSILGAVLLLPGMSMCSGAINRKTQRYNPASAGVSSTMLLYATLVMLSPTILYQIFGRYEERCESCAVEPNAGETCKRCHLVQSSVVIDKLFLDYLRPFSMICAICLFTAYCIGLLFTLKTHAALIWSTPVTGDKEKHTGTTNTPDNSSVTSMNLSKRPSKLQISMEQSALSRNLTRNATSVQQQVQPKLALQLPQEAEGNHDAPNWSRTKSTTILLLATLTYAIIAEMLVDVVDDVLKKFPINAKLLGLTVFALVPNTTEFINAILFAMHGNVALSMEIGSAYALQVCLLQIPIIVVYSCWSGVKAGIFDITKIFTLIFPRWDFVACLMSVYMFTYIYAEGKSNYFKGSILILLYISIIFGFYVAITIDSKYEEDILDVVQDVRWR